MNALNAKTSLKLESVQIPDPTDERFSSGFDCMQPDLAVTPDSCVKLRCSQPACNLSGLVHQVTSMVKYFQERFSDEIFSRNVSTSWRPEGSHSWQTPRAGPGLGPLVRGRRTCGMTLDTSWSTRCSPAGVAKGSSGRRRRRRAPATRAPRRRSRRICPS